MAREGRASGRPVVVWGAGGHATVVADILRLRGIEIAAFVDTVRIPQTDARHGDAPLWSRAHFEKHFRNMDVIVAIGDCDARHQIVGELRNAGASLSSALHPSAVIARDATIGSGVVIAAAAVIGPAVRVSDGVIVNTAATIDHECMLEEFVHVSPGAHLGGRVEVGERTWVGIGAVVKDCIIIGSGTIIGAGAAVVDDIPADVVAYGVPARVMRAR